MNVNIDNQTKERFDFRGYKKLIENVINAVAEDKKIPSDMDVEVLIVEPDVIKKINKEYRNINKVTDVLSFPYFDYKKPGVLNVKDLKESEQILGDMIICAKKIISQAKEYGHSQKRELTYLTLHSMLHLLGYDHMSKEDEIIMNKEAEKFMELFDIRR